MRKTKPVDEEFCRCVLEELRDGETVTVQSEQTAAAIRKAMLRLGATERELERLTIEPMGGA
jgi:hypothetical protein